MRGVIYSHPEISLYGNTRNKEYEYKETCQMLDDLSITIERLINITLLFSEIINSLLELLLRYSP
jgi:hypothetical protein